MSTERNETRETDATGEQRIKEATPSNGADTEQSSSVGIHSVAKGRHLHLRSAPPSTDVYDEAYPRQQRKWTTSYPSARVGTSGTG